MELTDTPNPEISARNTFRKQLDLPASLGLVLNAEDATIIDGWPGAPADKAVAPAMKVVAMNGRGFTPEGLELVLEAAKKKRPVEVLSGYVEFFQTYTLSYAGGPRWCETRGTPTCCRPSSRRWPAERSAVER